MVTELMTAVTTYVKCSLKSECFSDYFDQKKKKNHSMIPSFFLKYIIRLKEFKHFPTLTTFY